MPYLSAVDWWPIQKWTEYESLPASIIYVCSRMYASASWNWPYSSAGHGTTRNCSMRQSCSPGTLPASRHCGSCIDASCLIFFSSSVPKNAMFVSFQFGCRSLMPYLSGISYTLAALARASASADQASTLREIAVNMVTDRAAATLRAPDGPSAGSGLRAEAEVHRSKSPKSERRRVRFEFRHVNWETNVACSDGRFLTRPLLGSNFRGTQDPDVRRGSLRPFAPSPENVGMSR